MTNPIYLISESKGKWVYVANQGNNVTSTNAQSGIVGYVIDPATHQLTAHVGQPFHLRFGSAVPARGSFQSVHLHRQFQRFSVTGKSLDQNSGDLTASERKGQHGFQARPVSPPGAWSPDGRADGRSAESIGRDPAIRPVSPQLPGHPDLINQTRVRARASCRAVRSFDQNLGISADERCA